MIKILTIDGGGIRGVIPATVLAKIEELTKTPACRLFDLIAGTSTGGIIALGLTKPGNDGGPAFTAEDLANLYAEHGRDIFHRSIWRTIRTADAVLDERYPAAPLERVLDDYFGDARLKDALTDVLVMAYEIEIRSPWLFRSSRAQEKPEYDFPMAKVARATSAAPTYFEPIHLETTGRTEYWTLVDGGVYANNPTMCGIVEARTTYHAEDILVVSLGTGSLTRRIPYEEAKDWGLAGWVRPVIDIVFDGVSDTVDFQAEQLCPADPDGRPRYYRFQPELTIGNDNMDDASQTNIHALRLLAEQLIDANGEKLDALAGQLAEAAVGATAGPG